MFSITLPKNTWPLYSNFPKKSLLLGRNLAQRFFRLNSSSLAKERIIALTLSVLTVTPVVPLIMGGDSFLYQFNYVAIQEQNVAYNISFPMGLIS